MVATSSQRVSAGGAPAGDQESNHCVIVRAGVATQPTTGLWNGAGPHLIPASGNDTGRPPRSGSGLIWVGLTGASSKQKAQLRRLAASLPDVLARSEPAPPVANRQQQRRLSAAQAAELVAQYQAGDDMPVLAERWGISRKTVAEHLRRAGVTPRRRGLSPEQVQAAIELYGAGWSLARIGERFGCDHSVVLRALEQAGVPRRDSHGRSRKG
jgi:hypothetical protein